jgi:NAD(P)-dependent dehydrogenase (short-subunit alcohol dehydrogenase family)
MSGNERSRIPEVLSDRPLISHTFENRECVGHPATENICVNCICPAVIETEMIHSFITNQPDPEAARAQRVAMHPVRRFGKAEEIAELAVYLASDEAAFVTGAAFPVDGGYTAA